MSFNVIFFPISGYFSWVSFYLFCNIKPSNNQFCFSQCFPRIFLSFSCWKRKQTFLWSKTEFLFSQFWTSRKLVFFFKPFSIFQQLPYQMVATLNDNQLHGKLRTYLNFCSCEFLIAQKTKAINALFLLTSITRRTVWIFIYSKYVTYTSKYTQMTGVLYSYEQFKTN